MTFQIVGPCLQPLHYKSHFNLISICENYIDLLLFGLGVLPLLEVSESCISPAITRGDSRHALSTNDDNYNKRSYHLASNDPGWLHCPDWPPKPCSERRFGTPRQISRDAHAEREHFLKNTNWCLTNRLSEMG